VSQHSQSLLLVWRVAEIEARQAKSKEIAPTHFFIAICKVVDLDLPALFPEARPERDAILEECLHEVGRLRRVFELAHIDAASLRRRLRSQCKQENHAVQGEEFLHRSNAARAVFADAEAFADFASVPVFPIHLAYSLLIALMPDTQETLRQRGIDEAGLRQVVKDEMLRGGRKIGSKVHLS
jgi:hypothetical protein